ncbi:MAG: hypothetical protein XXXJIFNMEKO3_03491 [Candidatus Erwinia impunctatus]|nr:hypothetical protein XXXJIFNMEKO_03491 [Culicoides impunctatus]
MNQHKKQGIFRIAGLCQRGWKYFCNWRERVKTRKLMKTMDDARLKDIGLTRNDVDQL